MPAGFLKEIKDGNQFVGRRCVSRDGGGGERVKREEFLEDFQTGKINICCHFCEYSSVRTKFYFTLSIQHDIIIQIHRKQKTKIHKL